MNSPPDATTIDHLAAAPRRPAASGGIRAFPPGRSGVLATLTLALALLAVPAGCGGGRTPDDTVVVLIENAVKDPDPRFAYSSSDAKLARLVAAGLVAIDTPDLAPRLDLAESIIRINPTTYVATLRPGLHFCDGTPLEAADVAYTFSSVYAVDSASLFRKPFQERFEAVVADGPRRVWFFLDVPLATLTTDLEFGIVSRHAVAGNGRFTGGLVIGAGPYRVTEVNTAGLVLERNPHYHGEQARLPRVEIRTVRDANARIVMLMGGSADLAQNVVRLDLVDVIARRDKIKIEGGPSAILSYLLINNKLPVLADPRVRRAIMMGLDREQIIRARFGGRARVATGLLPTDHWAYEADVPRWDHDPARARALLDEAGLRDPDGDGPAPRIRLTYKTSADQFRVAVARLMAAQLAQIGIEVEVRPFEWATFFADVKKGNYDLASMQSSDISEPDFYFTFFNSSRIPDDKNPDGMNRWFYRDARVDELTEAGRHELDPARRLAIYSEAQKIVAAAVPIVPLWHEDNVVVMGANVSGYRILPNARLGGLVYVDKTK